MESYNAVEDHNFVDSETIPKEKIIKVARETQEELEKRLMGHL